MVRDGGGDDGILRIGEGAGRVGVCHGCFAGRRGMKVTEMGCAEAFMWVF